MKKSKEKFDYHLYPPYIDAYKNSFFENDKVTIEELKKEMENHAITWCDEIEEHAKKYGHEFPMHMDKYVICCASVFNGLECIKTFLIVVDSKENIYNQKFEFIEAGIDESWNVT